MINLCGEQSFQCCVSGGQSCQMSDVLLSRLIPSQNMQAAAECTPGRSTEHQAGVVNARKNIFIHGYFNFYQARDEKAKHLQFILNQMMVVTEKACLKSQFRLLSF